MQKLRTLVGVLLKVLLHARYRLLLVFAEERVVADADYRDVVGDGASGDAAGDDEARRVNVVVAQDRDRLWRGFADPFSIGGMGWYGSGSKFHITLPEESRVRKGGTRLFAYAPGAYRYEWTCDGVAVSGGENGELLVPYDHAKACNITTNTYTATAYYKVNGSEVKGTTTSADLVFKYNGVFINYK